MFQNIVKELIYLVDNGAYIDRPVIAKILEEGKDVVQYLEYALPYKIDFSALNADPDRDFYMDLLCRHYSGGGREKHYLAKNNGLLFLIELCLILAESEIFNEYKDVKVDWYLGKLTDEEMWKLKFIGVGYDDFVAH
jgi:hypothetical protein